MKTVKYIFQLIFYKII